MTPRSFDLQAVRGGNTDRSFLAALNAPGVVPAAAADATEGDGLVDGGGTRWTVQRGPSSPTAAAANASPAVTGSGLRPGRSPRTRRSSGRR